MKIVLPFDDNSNGYKISAEEFKKYYELITGVSLSISDVDDGYDIVLIGAPFINRVTFDLEMDGKIPVIDLKAGTDEFVVKTFHTKDRKILYLAGGNVRATLYAVYTYFEKCYGCSWYWDGDVVPKSQELFPEADIREKPRFQYRGLRYFAHRGCKRFQAEMWGLEDWKREIDYLLKKKLNLFMLRIGQDDLFQKAFPDTVSYPTQESMDSLNYCSSDPKNPYGGQGYNDRRLFWSLKYRGELRKKVLDYAFERGLMHPEDCGTMSHWYSPTPDDFIQNNPVDFIAPTNARTKNTLVFDIRKEREFGYYTKLTEEHIKHYGKAELFHTIGFAEQMVFDDREKNLRMKKYVYDRYLAYLKEKYPTCPVFIAGWDFLVKYENEEVSRLVSSLDENQCIIFDYTSDSAYKGNFTNWNVVGKFPYVFGQIHANASCNDMLGQYDRTQERLQIAKKDDYCKGMILWPELSHSDTLVQEFLAVNAWDSQVVSVEECIDRIAKGRAGKYSDTMAKVWKNVLPIIKLMHWNMVEEHPYWNSFYNYYHPNDYMWDLKSEDEYYLLGGMDFDKAVKSLQNAKECLREIVRLPKEAFENDLLKRDVTDIVRTLIARYIHILYLATAKSLIATDDTKTRQEKVNFYFAQIKKLFEGLKMVLSSSTDFSLYHTLMEISKESKVYDNFEQTLKNNTVAEYCRTNIYETVKEIFIPEQEVMQKALLSYAKDKNFDMHKFVSEGRAEILKQYMQTPLAKIDKEKKYSLIESIKYAHDVFENISID